MVILPHKYIHIMFILRKITAEGLEMNFSLGNGYNLIRRDANPGTFEVYKEGEQLVDPEKCFAIITADDGKIVLPLFKNQHNYIMTASGETFARLH